MSVIYVLKCPETGAVRYIGKAVNVTRRYAGHIHGAQNNNFQSHHLRWMRKLLRNGTKPKLEILLKVPADMKWQSAERFFIASARAFGFDLTNSTHGGDGLSFIDDADKAKHAAAVKRSLAGAEVRAKISAGVKAIASNPDRLAKQSEFMRARMADPKTRSEIIAALNKPEVVAANSARAIRQMADPKARRHLSQTAKKQWADPEALALRSLTSRQKMTNPSAREQSRRGAEMQNADPEYIRRRDEFWSRSESQQAAADHAKSGWTDPDKRAARIASMKAAWQRRKRNAAEQQSKAP